MGDGAPSTTPQPGNRTSKTGYLALILVDTRHSCAEQFIVCHISSALVSTMRLLRVILSPTVSCSLLFRLQCCLLAAPEEASESTPNHLYLTGQSPAEQMAFGLVEVPRYDQSQERPGAGIRKLDNSCAEMRLAGACKAFWLPRREIPDISSCPPSLICWC